MVSCGLNATGGQCPVLPACHFCDLKLSSLLARTGIISCRISGEAVFRAVALLLHFEASRFFASSVASISSTG